MNSDSQALNTGDISENTSGSSSFLKNMLTDLVGPAQATLISEEIGATIETAKLLGWKELRPWAGEFFAVFKPPQWNMKYLETRMVTNLLHFRSNYVLICAVLSLVMVLMSPMLIFTLLCIAGISVYYNFVLKGKPLVINNTKVTEQQKTYACLIINLGIFFLLGSLWSVLKISIYCIGICGVHMIFRPRSVAAKSNKIYEEFRMNNKGSTFSIFTGNGVTNDDVGKADLESPPVKEDAGYTNGPGPNGNVDNMRKRPAK